MCIRDRLYPQYHGSFAQRVICDDSYAQTIIDDFKQPEKEPHIAVSVDMMDTGIDVPECVNLVFFKKVHSKAKFWQMIGRGTRLCKGLSCVDQIDGVYTDKRRFLIFDYCGNFEYLSLIHICPGGIAVSFSLFHPPNLSKKARPPNRISPAVDMQFDST